MIGKYLGALRRAERIPGYNGPSAGPILRILQGVSLAEYNDPRWSCAWVAQVCDATERVRREWRAREEMLGILRIAADAEEDEGEETLVDYILNEGLKEVPWGESINLVNALPLALAKELMKGMIRVEEDDVLLPYAISRAVEAAEENQMSIDDLDWFVPVMLGVAGQVEKYGGDGYDHIVALVRDETVKIEAIRRLDVIKVANWGGCKAGFAEKIIGFLNGEYPFEKQKIRFPSAFFLAVAECLEAGRLFQVVKHREWCSSCGETTGQGCDHSMGEAVFHRVEEIWCRNNRVLMVRGSRPNDSYVLDITKMSRETIAAAWDDAVGHVGM